MSADFSPPANLFTRNIYKEYLRRDASDCEQAEVSKITSLAVKAGAISFILALHREPGHGGRPSVSERSGNPERAGRTA
jgi:Na+/proline symporter